jgi:hypothetical protein
MKAFFKAIIADKIPQLLDEASPVRASIRTTIDGARHGVPDRHQLSSCAFPDKATRSTTWLKPLSTAE